MAFNLFKFKKTPKLAEKALTDNQLEQNNSKLELNTSTSVKQDVEDISDENRTSKNLNGETNPVSMSNLQEPSIGIEANNIENSASTSWLKKLGLGLAKTRVGLSNSLINVLGSDTIDEEIYEELETALLSCDINLATTTYLLDATRSKLSKAQLRDINNLKQALKLSIIELLQPLQVSASEDLLNSKPYVIMVAGVNGAGKTTSIGKLTKYYQSKGKTVLLAAGDTFRAAAKEQLIQWGERNNVTVVSAQSSDSASVCFDAVNSAIAKKIDVVILDTAGRLPTQLNLMQEIKKVKKTITKVIPEAPHEILLVLDASIGQNGLSQVKAFNEALGLTGLIVTKLDGTAKGGAICNIAMEHKIKLKFIGVGEGIDDLRPFNANEYVNALFD